MFISFSRYLEGKVNLTVEIYGCLKMAIQLVKITTPVFFAFKFRNQRYVQLVQDKYRCCGTSSTSRHPESNRCHNGKRGSFLRGTLQNVGHCKGICNNAF